MELATVKSGRVSPRTASGREINSLHNFLKRPICYDCSLRSALPSWWEAILRLFRSRRDLLVENLALRQQLIVFMRRNQPPKLSALDKLFWVLAWRFWSDWKKSLLMVAPVTVVRGHRAGFCLY
jgi:hypothetical protein